MIQLEIHPRLLVLVDDKPDRNSAKIECTYSHGGSWYERPEDRGRRHLLEHCLVARTQNLNQDEFKEYCYTHALTYNAYTSPSVIQINGKSHKDDTGILLDLFAELFFSPTFDEEVLTREKEIVLRELVERQGDSDYTLWKEVSEQFFTQDSYECHEVLGEYKTVQSTTLADLQRIYQSLINTSKYVITFSGSGWDIEKITNLLGKYTHVYNQTTAALPFPHVYPNTFTQKGFHCIQHPLAHQAGAITFYIPCPVTYENRPIRTIINELYLGWNGTGLFDYLRDELGLVYGYQYNYELSGGWLRLDCTTELTKVSEVMNAIKEYFVRASTQIQLVKFGSTKTNAIKKFEQARDTLGFDSNWMVETLFSFNTIQTSEEYVQTLQFVKPEEVMLFCASLAKEFHRGVGYVVSRDANVTNLHYEV